MHRFPRYPLFLHEGYVSRCCVLGIVLSGGVVLVLRMTDNSVLIEPTNSIQEAIRWRSKFICLGNIGKLAPETRKHA